MEKELKTMLHGEKLEHSLGVRKAAIKLADIYGCDIKKASIAGLLHDCAKNFDESKILKLCDDFGIELDNVLKMEVKLLHGPVGAEIAKRKFSVEDEEILDAIRFHTVGKAKMSLLTKIIYLADYIEPGRKFAGVNKLRELAYEYRDLNKALLLGLDRTIKRVVDKGKLLHPKTIEARNYLLIEKEHGNNEKNIVK